MRHVVRLQDPSTGEIRSVKVGWSWVMLFFSTWLGAPFFWRGMAVLGLAFFGLSILGFVAGALENAALTVGVLVVQGIASIWMAIKGNEITAKHYLARGWQIAEPSSFAAHVAAEKWHLPRSATPHPYPIIVQRSGSLGAVIGIGIVSAIAVVVALVVMDENSLGIELTRHDFLAGDGRLLAIVNKGEKPIRISKISINERKDCTADFYQELFVDKHFASVELKVGDSVLIRSSCRIIRANIDSDQGSNSYSF